MKLPSKYLLPVLVFLLTGLPSAMNSATPAKYAGEFISIGVGARALGLGGAYAAVANDVTAGYWNPAGLSELSYPQIVLMHDERFGGLENYDYGAVAIPVSSRSTLALSVIRLGVDDIPNTQNAWVDLNHDGLIESNETIDQSKITYFNAADWAFYLSYAKKTSDAFSYGANLKFIRRENGPASATGVGFDVAARFHPDEHWVLAANFQDVTTTLVAWSTGTNELITPTLKIGSAYFWDALGGRFAPAEDVDVRFENRKSESNAHLGAVSFDFHSGVEYVFKKLLAVRFGYSDIGSMNVGAGIHLPKLDIDYSFAKFDGTDQLDNTHRISLTFTLEAEQYARSAE